MKNPDVRLGDGRGGKGRAEGKSFLGEEKEGRSSLCDDFEVFRRGKRGDSDEKGSGGLEERDNRKDFKLFEAERGTWWPLEREGVGRRSR